MTLAMIKSGVLRREFVAVLAMGFAGVLRGNGIAAQVIYLQRYRLQVAGVHANLYFAKVVKRKALWNWAHQKLIREPVRKLAFKINVARTTWATLPKPTTGRAVNLLPKPANRVGLFFEFHTRMHYRCYGGSAT